MKDALYKFLMIALIKVRWWYFHINPMYVKFYVDVTDKVGSFQNRRTGSLHCNYKWVDEPVSGHGR